MLLFYKLIYFVSKLFYCQKTTFVAPYVRQLIQMLIHVDQKTSAFNCFENFLVLKVGQVGVVLFVVKKPVYILFGYYFVGYGSCYKRSSFL
jgi:hypothetical protein